MPVVILSGFLGAGKTTALQHVLRGDHGYRLGVIVNDLAAVNVDAALLEGAVYQAGAQSIQLANGCVCCTASGSLRSSVLELAAGKGKGYELDAIVVELSGVAEPQKAKDLLDGFATDNFNPDIPRPFVAQTITIVDTPAFGSDFVAKPRQKDEPFDETGAERYGMLLAEQVEAANFVVLNKADAATLDELQQVEAVVRSMNRSAELCIVEHGQVPYRSFLPISPRWQTKPSSDISMAANRVHQQNMESQRLEHDQRHSHGHKHGHDHGHHHGHSRDLDNHGHHYGHSHDHSDCNDPHCTDPTHDHRSSAERRFDIKSFVYTASRPFNRNRFTLELQGWCEAWKKMGKRLDLQQDLDIPESAEQIHRHEANVASAFEPVLRSKGVLWLDSHPSLAITWSHAGRSARQSVWGRWGSAVDGESTWLETPRSELVFIGAGIDEDAVRTALNSCVLTDEEMLNIPQFQRS